MYVVINGGGKVASYLAKQLLEHGHAVALIERREETARKLAAELPGTPLIILGDGCDSVYQEDAGVTRADVFVAATGDDDDNLVACQLAKIAFGVSRAVARINNPKNEHIFHALGIEAISSTTIISRLIEEEATVGDMRTLMALRKGDMAIVEIDLPPDQCVACGERVADLDLPVDCVIVALLRGDDAIAVHGDTRMMPGDTVIAFAKVTNERALKKVLIGV